MRLLREVATGQLEAGPRERGYYGRRRGDDRVNAVTTNERSGLLD